MNLSEFKTLFTRRCLYLVGTEEEAHWVGRELEGIGFLGKSMDNNQWRQGIPFQGEIWATSSGTNWTFRRPYDADVRHPISMTVSDFYSILYGDSNSEEEIPCGSLEDVL